MDVSALKEKVQNVRFMSTGSGDYETGDQCFVAAPAAAVRNDFKPGGPAPTLA